MLTNSSKNACFEHFVFLTVKEMDYETNPVKGRNALHQEGSRHHHAQSKKEGQFERSQSSTTNLLTATTLIYAIGAGFTAAAGTRLALQLFFVKDFRFYSFQLPNL